MWFYKIDGVLDGFTFPEDRGTRSRAAQEFQSKQTLFSKKLQGKCYITVSQIKGGRITLAAVSLESYNILARCREFLREAEVPVKNLIAQEITYDVLRSLLQAAERWGFLEDDRDVYNLFHLEELQHNIYDFQEFLLPERATLGQQKKETAQLFCQDAFDPELERIYQGPVQLVNSGHPVHYLLVCDEGKARDKQVELLLSALYQNGRICSQRYTYMDVDSDERVDDSLLETLYSASAGGAMVLGYADGVPRALSNGRGTVLLHHRKAPIVGAVCMDQLMVDITKIPQTSPGDIATLLGKDGAEKITAYDMAEAAGTITNEILSRLGARLERIQTKTDTHKY